MLSMNAVIVPDAEPIHQPTELPTNVPTSVKTFRTIPLEMMSQSARMPCGVAALVPYATRTILMT